MYFQHLRCTPVGRSLSSFRVESSRCTLGRPAGQDPGRSNGTILRNRGPFLRRQEARAHWWARREDLHHHTRRQRDLEEARGAAGARPLFSW